MIEQFSKDKRPRRRIVAAEAVTRSPRGEGSFNKSADGSEKPYSRDDVSKRRDDQPQRRSYNPNFSADNRFVGGGDSGRNYDNRRSFDRGEGSDRYNRTDRGERPERDFNRWDAPSSEGQRKPYGAGGGKPYGSGYKSSGGDRKPFGDKKPYGDKPSFGGGKSYGSKSYGDRPSSGAKKPFGPKKPFVKRGPGAMDAGAKPISYPSYSAAAETAGEMRLNRYISTSGKCSRREADDLIKTGEVTVNGVVVDTLGTKVQPGDEIRLRGEVLSNQRKVYILMNKPKGYVTSMEDPHADKTVMDIVRNACAERIYPVGRLDKSSVGVLLLTNDGELTQKLTHPSNNKKKIYQVTLERPLTNNDLLRARDGIDLDDGIIIPDAVEFVGPDNRKEVGIEIHSGRNRIVRRIFEELGYGVHKLDRVYFAGLTKKNLKRGQWRFLSDAEVSMLKTGRYE